MSSESLAKTRPRECRLFPWPRFHDRQKWDCKLLSLLRFIGLGSRLTRYTPVGEDIGHGIAADSVGAVHDPGDFAGRPKTRDYLAVAVNEPGLCADDAAHGVVALHRDDASVERHFDDLVDERRYPAS